VEINDIEREIRLQRAKCFSAIGQDRFEEERKESCLKTISMLFNPIDLFQIRFMVRESSG
jgi:hypothetical protein